MIFHGLYAGYILGFPGDTRESILRDIEIIKRELPLDVVEFFFLTPLPGSEDHQKLSKNGVWMDPDLNKYDLNHRVSRHPRMSDAEWEAVYREAWDAFYTPDHVRTVLRRAVANPRSRPGTILSTILWFYLMVKFEGVHPLEGGAFRLKHRRDRRRGMPLESPLVFYPRFLADTARKLFGYASIYLRYTAILRGAKAAPDRMAWSDVAIAPPGSDEFEALELYSATNGGGAAVARKRRDDGIRAESASAAGAP